MTKVLVTGATGFIGTYLVDRLVRDGVEVVACGRRADAAEYYRKLGVQFITLDITRPRQFSWLPKDVTHVAHLAGLLSIDMHTPLDYLQVNAYGTYNLLEYCRQNNVGTVVFSMTHSNVNKAEAVDITEKTPEKFGGPATPYIVSKVAAMRFVESFSRDYGIRGVSLRLPGVRGYGSRFISFWDGTPEVSVFHRFVMKALRGEPIEVWGKHETVRDLVYVKDVVQGFIKALRCKNAYGLYNLGSGQGYTIEDEAKAIVEAFSSPNNPSPIVYRPDIPEVPRKSFVFSIGKAQHDFGYMPEYSYVSAMRDMKLELDSGRFKHLVSIEEDVLRRRTGLTLDQLLRRPQA